MSDKDKAESRAGEQFAKGNRAGTFGEMLPVYFKEALAELSNQLLSDHPDIPQINISLELGSLIYLAFYDAIQLCPDIGFKEEIMNIFLLRQGLSPEVQRRVEVYSYILNKRTAQSEDEALSEIGTAFAEALGEQNNIILSYWASATFYLRRTAILKSLYILLDIEIPEELL